MKQPVPIADETDAIREVETAVTGLDAAATARVFAFVLDRKRAADRSATMDQIGDQVRKGLEAAMKQAADTCNCDECRREREARERAN